MDGMTLRITAAQPLDGHNLRLTFNDGLVRDVDVSSLLHGALGEPLRDPEYFRQVRVDENSRTIVWPNGLDPDPDMLHDEYPATEKFAVLDLIELTEPFDGIPAGATGGLLELNDDDTAMVEITSIPELDIERIIFPPLSKLRRTGSALEKPRIAAA
jgi:hypothetical protein